MPNDFARGRPLKTDDLEQDVAFTDEPSLQSYLKKNKKSPANQAPLTKHSEEATGWKNVVKWRVSHLVATRMGASLGIRSTFNEVFKIPGIGPVWLGQIPGDTGGTVSYPKLRKALQATSASQEPIILLFLQAIEDFEAAQNVTLTGGAKALPVQTQNDLVVRRITIADYAYAYGPSEETQVQFNNVLEDIQLLIRYIIQKNQMSGAALTDIESLIQNHLKIYAHCKAGVNRSFKLICAVSAVFVLLNQKQNGTHITNDFIYETVIRVCSEVKHNRPETEFQAEVVHVTLENEKGEKQRDKRYKDICQAQFIANLVRGGLSSLDVDLEPLGNNDQWSEASPSWGIVKHIVLKPLEDYRKTLSVKSIQSESMTDDEYVAQKNQLELKRNHIGQLIRLLNDGEFELVASLYDIEKVIGLKLRRKKEESLREIETELRVVEAELCAVEAELRPVEAELRDAETKLCVAEAELKAADKALFEFFQKELTEQVGCCQSDSEDDDSGRNAEKVVLKEQVKKCLANVTETETARMHIIDNLTATKTARMHIIDNLTATKIARKHIIDNIVDQDVPPSVSRERLVNTWQPIVETVKQARFSDLLKRLEKNLNKNVEMKESDSCTTDTHLVSADDDLASSDSTSGPSPRPVEHRQSPQPLNEGGAIDAPGSPSSVRFGFASGHGDERMSDVKGMRVLA